MRSSDDVSGPLGVDAQPLALMLLVTTGADEPPADMRLGLGVGVRLQLWLQPKLLLYAPTTPLGLRA